MNYYTRNCRVGFTLAEVLITLGVIGVVAAMTLPSLITDYKKKETTARLTKFYSMMSQAMISSEMENGSASDWGKPSQIIIDGVYDTDLNSNISDAFFRKYLAPYLKFVSAEKDPNFDNYTKVVFIDGSVMFVRNGGCYDIFFDTNGDRKPNSTGYDRFVFLICTPDSDAQDNFSKGIHFGPYGPKTDDRNVALQHCKTNTNYCGRLLQIDNWEIKDDYPWY